MIISIFTDPTKLLTDGSNADSDIDIGAYAFTTTGLGTFGNLDVNGTCRFGDHSTNYTAVSSTGDITFVGSATMGSASTSVIPFTGRAVFRTLATDPTANNHAGSLGEIIYCSATDAYYGKTVADGTDQNWTLLG